MHHPDHSRRRTVAVRSILSHIAGTGRFGISADGGKATPAGAISTIGGDGPLGYSGDGGAAGDASLCRPSGIAVIAAGDAFVADACNNAVRMLRK